MSKEASRTTGQLRTYRATATLIVVLIVAVTVTAMVGYFAPEVVRPFQFPVGAAMVFGAALIAVLAYSVYLGFREDMKHAVTTFEQGLASAHRDVLTGAMTRAYFLTELKNRLRRLDEEPVAFVQIDMDHLKQLNDGAGHVAGDAALRHMTATIEQVLPQALIGRLGGDEFGIIILGSDNIQAVARVCRQVLDALSVPTPIGGRHVSLSASIGFAVAPRHANQTDDLISKADLALYQGKKMGRNAVVAFHEDMLSDERHKRFIERELRAAILTSELDLFYQPIYLADGETLKSYEALVRWNHPVRGLIAPSDFVPVAEESVLIEQLGEWVLRRACEEFAALETPSLSINVSPVQLRRSDFAGRFAAILEEACIDPGCIAVEITENVPLAEAGVEMTNVDALKALGVRIAIDDFGSGNASLSYLRRAAFDIVKIDRSYVDKIATSPLDSLMIASICRIARAARMSVIAEGIENADQMAAVTAAGVTALQGFHLGRPQPLRTILAARRGIGAEHAA